MADVRSVNVEIVFADQLPITVTPSTGTGLAGDAVATSEGALDGGAAPITLPMPSEGDAAGAGGVGTLAGVEDGGAAPEAPGVSTGASEVGGAAGGAGLAPDGRGTDEREGDD